MMSPRHSPRGKTSWNQDKQGVFVRRNNYGSVNPQMNLATPNAHQ